MHVARFGDRFDAQGVLSGSKDAARCIGYLTKYLTKQVADCHQAQTDAERAHADRLAEALRFEPCSPRCANWLRYGIQPKNARPGLVPGACKGKAHRREHLGYAGRRVLTSRKWSGKTLADHRADRKNWLLATLGDFGNRPGPLRLGTGHPRRPRPHGTRPAAAARRRRPRPLASRAGRGAEASRRWRPPRGCSGNREGGLIMRHGVDRFVQGPGTARLLLTVPEAAEALAISRSKLYELLAAGVVASIRIDGSRRIPLAALETYIAGRLRAEDAA